MTQALKTMEFHKVDKVYSVILTNNIDIDVKIKHQAQVTHLKLEKELDIRNFIKSVEHVEDYKTILKSVKILEQKVETARNLGVDLDLGVIADVNRCTSRLISERNLRFHMEMTHIHKSEHDHVDQLKNLIEKALEHNVAASYMEQAEKLMHQMSGNIKAREILQMMHDYPEREYPIPEPVDPKNKNKKPSEKDKEKKKKKKKKEPPFPIPEWATELEALVSHVQQMENLLHDAEHLHLQQDFVQKVNSQLQRFKKEIAFRRQQEEEKRREEEEKKNKKKKKK